MKYYRRKESTYILNQQDAIAIQKIETVFCQTCCKTSDEKCQRLNCNIRPFDRFVCNLLAEISKTGEEGNILKEDVPFFKKILHGKTGNGVSGWCLEHHGERIFCQMSIQDSMSEKEKEGFTHIIN